MARPDLSRSDSSTSNTSRITIANDNNAIQTEPQSSTPPTSVTDGASVSSGNTMKEHTSNVSSGRARRVKATVSSYNENTLAGSARKKAGAKGLEESRIVSEKTLVVSSNGSPEGLLQSSVAALNMEWDVGRLPDHSVKHSSINTNNTRTGSLRSRLVDKAAAAVSKTTSVLGKRGRDAVSAGKETLQSIERTANLRARVLPSQDLQVVDEPAAKKVKTSDNLDSQGPTLGGYKPRHKRYISQGLYVGQDPRLDPRYKQSKAGSKNLETTSKPRTILPSPMFGGQTLLDQGRNFRLPYNIFSPLPPGQPKPEEWRKTQKNVFVGDAAEFWKTSKDLELSTCICQPETGCDEGCFNRFMFYECDDDNCNFGPEHCTNRSFEDLRKRCKKGGKYNVGVDVIKTADRGYGVRSNRTFEANQIILEYTGEIITQDECDSRMRKMYKNNECFYLMVFDQNMIIDATRGSIARFVNHSCEPNCKMIKWTVAGKPRMALFAGDKGIMTGEELTYDYNFDPFSSKNIQECRCGASSCRGVLGPRPKPEKEIKDALNPITQAGTKRKFSNALGSAKEAVQSAIKKRKVALPKSLKNAVGSAKSSTVSSRSTAKTSTSAKANKKAIAAKTTQRGLKNTVKASKKRATTSVSFKKRKPVARANNTKSTAQQKGPSATGTGTTRKNVVSTIKGVKRSGANKGKSIKIVT